MPVTVIGIDPGSQKTGWGVVREASGVLSLVDCGIIRTSQTETIFSRRLALIFSQLLQILNRLQPEEAAIEDVFVSQNSKTALKLGQARGVAVACCASKNIQVSDYPPALVKKALVGTGRADKEQVAYMVRTFLHIPDAHFSLDTSDALGLAICHISLRSSPLAY